MKRWIAVATALAALLIVPSAFAGGDHDDEWSGSRSYQRENRDHDGDKRDDGYRRHHEADDDDGDDRHHGKADRDDDDDRDRDEGDREDGQDDRGDDDGDDDRGEPETPADVCPNFEGLQTSLPPAFVLDAAGQCAFVQRVVTITVASATPTPPAAAAALPSVVQ
jgi:hypothetical protein